ncbi:MAG: hypothetical protein JWQ39_2277 [Glaciihabitans sp.]|jgi:protein-S-isoprenylcysteine O-methyltransferase Ste14|nr:hypothetical protein [Glaciihabitans sp.]
MTSASASIELPSTKRAKNPAATVALVVAIVGFLVTQVPDFIGVLAGGPEDLVAVILGIIGIVIAFKRGAGKKKAIAATIVAAAALFGMPFGEGWLW